MFHDDFQGPYLRITSPCLEPKFDHNLRVTDIRIWGGGGLWHFPFEERYLICVRYRQSVICLPPRRPTFCPRPVHVGFVVDGGALGQIFLQVARTCFTLLTTLAILHHLLIYFLSYSVYRSVAGLFPFTCFSFLMGRLLIYAHFFKNKEKVMMYFGHSLSVSFHQFVCLFVCLFVLICSFLKPFLFLE